MLEASSPVACPNKLALVTFPASGKAAGRISRSSQPGSQPGPDLSQAERRRSTINWTFEQNKSYTSNKHHHNHDNTHINTRNHASRRPKTQDPQNQRKSRRLNFLRFRFPPGIPHGLPQAQSAARRTWPRAGAKKGEGSGSAGEKRGAHNVLPKISDQRNNMLT